MAEMEGTRLRKRSSVGGTGVSSSAGGVLHTSGSGEEMRRTTRAASKRAAIDDAARVACPVSGVQQAKKRAALANLSNLASIPTSRNASPVSEVNVKKRAALASLSNHSNVPVTRNFAPGGSKSGASSLGGVGKIKQAAATLSKKVEAEPVAASKKEAAQEKAPSKIPAVVLTPVAVEDQENVPPQPMKKSSDLHAELKPGTFSGAPSIPCSKTAGTQSNASVIASLERKTLENLYISRNTKSLHHEFGGWPASQNYTDIDGDLGDPQMCSIYAIDIYQHLRMQEVKRRPATEFMENLQQDINASMRGILIDWLVEVAEEYKLVPDTLYLTVAYIDRFLSNNVVNRQRLQLLGVSCMLIAAKYEEICAPQVEEFCYITDNTYAREDVLEMERRVLSNLHFELTTPTTKSFLRRFIRAAQAGYPVPALQLEFLGNYLAELTLVEYTFLHYLPSLVAASAVFVAKLTLDSDTSPWNSTLQHYSGYRPSELQECVREIHELQLNSKNCTLPAIREKYSQHKFKCVANLTPSPKIPAEYFQDLEM
ncbi:cyclin-A [Marchantia polymorpha subsp. ruderalis]|nr:hypothetical protein MARPO_0025s0128 [Marchantia polymorpha]BBN03686.1 hypothetical protein Mp_2g25500 [Marchantia polymorpha subsp. ruderalis]|eukprot:PTQ43446.1 hypothetical protein MARPO_0025s0128 [Marchantia polymorpha]